MAEEDKYSLEYTPTWAVAVVCSVFVIISLGLERGIHYLGKKFRKGNRKPLSEALEKLKEELMLLGFISLLLTVFQGPINHICIPKSYTYHMLPCKRETEDVSEERPTSETGSHHRKLFWVLESTRRLLSEGAGAVHCEKKGKAPFLSTEGLHQLHIFIFVLAIVHVVFCALTMILGSAKIRTWKPWEDEIKEKNRSEDAQKKEVIYVEEHHFVKRHAKESAVLSWMVSLLKQFYGSVTKSDYTILRLGFIERHCKGNKNFDFHKYMMRTLEADFKKVVGISGYLWGFVVIFLLLNIDGWHTYFWIAFVPLILLLAVGAKLEHVIAQLAQEVASKHTAFQGEIVVQPSDEHFWFGRPKLVLHLIHFILFQNAFEIAFFFWILTTYGFDSCIMGRVRYIVPRLVIGVIIQVLCSYSTLPLYAIVTQMGTTLKKSVFDEAVQRRLMDWRRDARHKVKTRHNVESQSEHDTGIQMLTASALPQTETRIFHGDDTSSDSEAPIIAAHRAIDIPEFRSPSLQGQ